MITDVNQVLTVDIIVLSNDIESHAFRAILESFNIQTRMHYIGNVKHLIALFQTPNYLYKNIIICCHGDKDGMFIPELSPELEEIMPYHKKLTPSNLSSFLNLHDQVVVNTGCCLGSENFAKSFLQRGAAAYIGASDYIEGNDTILFIVNFFYFYFVKSMSIKEAFHKAISIEEGSKMMKLWQGDGNISKV